MFASIYSFEDNTFCVLGRQSKKLTLDGDFKAKETVKTTWDKRIFTGVIVKIGDNEEDLTDFGNRAYKKFLKNVKPGSLDIESFPQEIFEFQHKEKLAAKRKATKTEKLRESEAQQDQLSPKKKRKETDKAPQNARQEIGKPKKKIITEKKNAKAAIERSNLESCNEMLRELTESLDCQFQNGEDLIKTDTGSLTEKTTAEESECLNRKATTSLTSTWELCTETSKTGPNEHDFSLPDPPLAMVNFFKALQTREVQEYIRKFIDCYEKTNKEQEKSYYVNELQSSQIMPSPHFVQDNYSVPTIQDEQSPNTCNTYSYDTISSQAQHAQEDNFSTVPFTHSYNSYSTPDMTCTQEDTYSYQSTSSMSDHNKTYSFHKTSAPCQVETNQTENPDQHTDYSNIISPSRHAPSTYPSHPKSPTRRSPRKLNTPSATPGRTPNLTQENPCSSRTPQSDKVKLLSHEELLIERRELRKATSAADKCAPKKAAFTLASKLLPHFFTMEELARSRGQGLRKAKEGDIRPVLDSKTIDIIREYVDNWLKRNGKPHSDAQFNDAITEKISYARRLMKKNL